MRIFPNSVEKLLETSQKPQKVQKTAISLKKKTENPLKHLISIESREFSCEKGQNPPKTPKMARLTQNRHKITRNDPFPPQSGEFSPKKPKVKKTNQTTAKNVAETSLKRRWNVAGTSLERRWNVAGTSVSWENRRI